MCGVILMPDDVSGSDKIHTLVALYTALLSNRRQTHTHRRTHTHAHRLTHTHTHTCMHAFTQSMIFIVQAIDRCVLLTSWIESPDVHLILDEFCPTSGAFCEAGEHENMSVSYERISQHIATCTISLVRYIPTNTTPQWYSGV